MEVRLSDFLGRLLLAGCLGVGLLLRATATPANKVALEKHYDRYLTRSLARCTTCHLPSDRKFPENLNEFPHNPFGNRLRKLGEEWTNTGKNRDLSARLTAVATEDSDGDGVANETEILLGHNPGDPTDRPSPSELLTTDNRVAEFATFLSRYRWRPFEPVVRPTPPQIPDPPFLVRNPIDSFLAAEWQTHGLKPRPEATKEVLLRRLYLDLLGLTPTPAEQRAFLNDPAPDAYEQLVDRLLNDPRHGERWARHWMDVWRYSDWAGWADGNQIRDSKPHIWRWRDWIVESLNTDKPYDRMVMEMLAADELAPEDPDALRATGFLVRNYKMLSREQWLEDTVKHTSQAFLGVTMGCAKCHDHMFDPISQREYYELRAVFEPHQVRTDRLPGQLDTTKDGLVRAYDATNTPTYLLVRGDERHPLTNEVIPPGVPAALGGKLGVTEVALPRLVANPDEREFVIRDTKGASEESLRQARQALNQTKNATNGMPATIGEAELALDLAEKKHAALLAVLATERGTDSPPALRLATNAVLLQQTATLAEARLKQFRAQVAVATAETNKLDEAKKKLSEADQQLAAAIETVAKPLDAAFKPRPTETFPATSTGRRLAFARWVANSSNPLTARVAVNHVWLRHFGRGLVPTPADFGRNGRPATNPQLIDWLAAEFMEPTCDSGGLPASPPTTHSQPWSFRHLHRLIVLSSTYRMASTPDAADLAADPDNTYLWRMNSHRLEAEAVRDNLLYVAGTLDPTRGGPDLDHLLAQTSPRRSLYLRHAAEKQSEFLQIFDGAGVTECYERHPSVMPQQALALGNSELALRQAKLLAKTLGEESDRNEFRFVELAFERVLARRPTEAEQQACLDHLTQRPANTNTTDQSFQRAAENLILVLFNHNDFVTVR